MADPGFPGQHTTTTTVTSNTVVQTNVRFDPSYIRTIPGILKIVEIVVNIIGFICIEASGIFSHHSRGTFFNFVSMTAFWFTGILLVLYLFHLIEKFYKLPWLKVEFVFDTTWTLFYLIASCLALTYGPDAYKAASFFGFCGMVAYGADAFFKFKAIQGGQLAQGERVINKQTSTVTSPTY